MTSKRGYLRDLLNPDGILIRALGFRLIGVSFLLVEAPGRLLFGLFCMHQKRPFLVQLFRSRFSIHATVVTLAEADCGSCTTGTSLRQNLEVQSRMGIGRGVPRHPPVIRIKSHIQFIEFAVQPVQVLVLLSEVLIEVAVENGVDAGGAEAEEIEGCVDYRLIALDQRPKKKEAL
jgi:hypothetical protein